AASWSSGPTGPRLVPPRAASASRRSCSMQTATGSAASSSSTRPLARTSSAARRHARFRRFVVTWTDDSHSGGDTSDYAVRGRIFEANGTSVGGEVLLNTSTAGAQFTPSVTALAAGGFVTIWLDYDS